MSINVRRADGKGSLWTRRAKKSAQIMGWQDYQRWAHVGPGGPHIVLGGEYSPPTLLHSHRQPEFMVAGAFGYGIISILDHGNIV